MALLAVEHLCEALAPGLELKLVLPQAQECRIM